MENKHVNKIKAACAVVTSACFAWGVRSAWKQSKPLKPNELTNANLLGGAGFAAKALGLATVITISGFGLLILSVSAAMGVNTPKQFGNRMKETFGDRYRLNRSMSGESYETLTELFEAASKSKKLKNEELQSTTTENRQ